MISSSQVIVRLLLAAALGSIIGLERERLHWAAGLRTHMLVCVGSTLIMLVSAFGFADALGPSNVVLDPSRVAAQVVSGIGFLGAGTILFRREVIHGLTTAASLWTVAAIGLAVGGGLYLPAVAATGLILAILIGLKPLERRLSAHRRQLRKLIVQIDPQQTAQATIDAALVKAIFLVKQCDLIAGENPGCPELHFIVWTNSVDELADFADYLRTLPGVIAAKAM